MCFMRRYHPDKIESVRLIRAWYFCPFLENGGGPYTPIPFSNQLQTPVYDSIWEYMYIMSELDPTNRRNLHFPKFLWAISGRILSRPCIQLQIGINNYIRDSMAHPALHWTMLQKQIRLPLKQVSVYEINSHSHSYIC